MDEAGLLASTAAIRWIGVTKSSNADRAIEPGENLINKYLTD
jgi:hypothetical protein